jgi:hypothetical protein
LALRRGDISMTDWHQACKGSVAARSPPWLSLQDRTHPMRSPTPRGLPGPFRERLSFQWRVTSVMSTEWNGCYCIAPCPVFFFPMSRLASDLRLPVSSFHSALHSALAYHRQLASLFPVSERVLDPMPRQLRSDAMHPGKPRTYMHDARSSL